MSMSNALPGILFIFYIVIVILILDACVFFSVFELMHNKKYINIT